MRTIFGLPEWLRSSLCSRYYMKTGFILLGGTLPLAGMAFLPTLAFVQATLGCPIAGLAAFVMVARILKLDPRPATVLGTGAAFGISGSIVAGRAVEARDEHVAAGITMTSMAVWLLVPAMSALASWATPAVLSPASAGVWVGTVTQSDTGALRAVAELGRRFGDAPYEAYAEIRQSREVWMVVFVVAVALVVAVRRNARVQGRGARVSALWRPTASKVGCRLQAIDS